MIAYASTPEYGTCDLWTKNANLIHFLAPNKEDKCIILFLGDANYFVI